MYVSHVNSSMAKGEIKYSSIKGSKMLLHKLYISRSEMGVSVTHETAGSGLKG